jgi:hypothetical protein
MRFLDLAIVGIHAEPSGWDHGSSARCYRDQPELGVTAKEIDATYCVVKTWASAAYYSLGE